MNETLRRCWRVLVVARGPAQGRPAARLRSPARNGAECMAERRARALRAATPMRLRMGRTREGRLSEGRRCGPYFEKHEICSESSGKEVTWLASKPR
jgi:hypothetical protein